MFVPPLAFCSTVLRLWMDADQWLLEVIVAWVYHKSVKIVVLLLLNMDWRSSCHMFPPARVCKSWCENRSGIHLYHLYFCMKRYRDIYMCTDYKHINKQPSAILPSPTILQPPRINKICLQPVEQNLPSACRIFFAYQAQNLWLQNSAQAVFTFMSCGCYLSGHGHPRSAHAKHLVRSASWWASALPPCSRATEARAICRTGSVYSGG